MASPMSLREIEALKLAAYRAGVEAAARVADDHDCPHCDGSGYYDQGGDKRLALMHAAQEIRALPDPTPEQMEEIK